MFICRNHIYREYLGDVYNMFCIEIIIEVMIYYLLYYPFSLKDTFFFQRQTFRYLTKYL